MNYPFTSRRQFLQKLAAATALAGISRPAFAQSLNNRLNVACIGVGGMGIDDIAGVAHENIVAFCDVDDERASSTYKKYPKVPRFKDYRVLFDKMGKQIDAVTISTPDHMHYPIARAALELGKHVYLQKPLTHTVWEARELTKLARSKKVVTQMGNQGRSSDGLRKIFESVRSGVIGDVREIHAYTDRPYWDQGVPRKTNDFPIPTTLDWNLWQGVAPAGKFNSDYVPSGWRGVRDFGTGALGDMGCHLLDASYYALHLQAPTSVTAEAKGLSKDMYPASSKIHFKFPARQVQMLSGNEWKKRELPAVSVFWYDGPRFGFKVPDSVAEFVSKNKSGQILIGDKGIIVANEYCGNFKVIGSKEPSAKKFLPRIKGNHYQDWIAACKGGAPACSNFDYAGPLTELVLLGNIALAAQKEIIWDSANLKITNDERANSLLTKSYRTF